MKSNLRLSILFLLTLFLVATLAFVPGRTGANGLWEKDRRSQQKREIKPNEKEKNRQIDATAPADEQEDSPDIPPFARGLISAEEYHSKRDAQIAMMRGLDHPRAAWLRPQAIQEMERQEALFREAAKKGLSRPELSGATWTAIGPAPLPNGQTETTVTPVSGRVSAIAVHPTNPNIAYVGAAQGGVYRTLDGGTTWTAIFDSAQSLAIGSIAIAPSQPATVYVGTGEPNGSCDSFFGVGIYRITNAESATPTLSGPFNSDGTNDVFTGRAVGRVVVHPTNPDMIFAGTTSGIGGLGCEAFGGGTVPPLPGRGLFRSTNATGACTFTKMTTATGTNIVVGNFTHVDVAMDPANPDRVLVSVNAAISPSGGGTGGGIYLSTNALAATPTFTRTLSLESVRIELTLHSAAGIVNVYAASGESNGRLRRSMDGGATWSAVLAAANGFCGGQCFYDIAVGVSPNDANIVLIGGNVTGASTKLIARSINGGTAFTNVSSGVHADNHAVTFAPSDANIVYMGTDGGIYKSTNNGQAWTSLSNTGFNATQFQSIAVHPTDAFFTIGGTQDNGTECRGPCGTNIGNTWVRADFGDGGHTEIDRNAINTTTVTMYHTYFNQSNAKGYARVLTTANAQDNGWTLHGCGFGGAIPNGFVCSGTTLFYAPMTLGPGNPNTLYFGADRLYRSSDSGSNMTTVSQVPLVAGVAISAIGISPQNDNVRVVGTANGQVFRTTTGANPIPNVTQAGMPARFVGQAVVDPNNVNTAYVAFTGFGVPAGQHIWKTTNLSTVPPTWTASSTGIPDVPVNALVVDPSNSNHVFAGTDIGVFISQNGGGIWSPFGSGLPRVAVFDMAIQNTNRILRIATHGRGIWEINIGVPTAAPANLSGRITTPAGSALGGAVVRLSGAATRTTVTDSAGNYRFENLDTESFYIVTPSLANYTFSPSSRSFSLTGNITDAGFTANPDAAQSANAIDTTEYFVRQHYLDFLGREPDQGGLEYWSAQINQCNGDVACSQQKRIDVSAAFFASAEFQQTGSYIYGLYAGTLGRTLNYGEFSADRAQVLGGAGLNQAKTTFSQNFVQRAEFTNRYPQSMTREQFVDAVIQTMQVRSGVSMTSYRDGFLVDYDTGGRALVARHASEANSFVVAEYNKAFVLMEYYGYLRRDIDPGGYAFWLDALNRGAGSSGMVCAFLTSTEYQHRFSTVVTHNNGECP